jgi:uncharacterized protein YkwD
VTTSGSSAASSEQVDTGEQWNSVGLPPFRRQFHVRTVFKFLLLILTAPPVLAAAPNWQQLPAEKFRELPEVKARIDFADYNRALMAAAIFHESNRVRQRMGLHAFRHLPKLDKAADLQASMGSLLVEMSHYNPLPSLHWAKERVQAVGLYPLVVAENIALSPTLDDEARKGGIGTRSEAGKRTFFDTQTGRELQQLTYAGFAAAVVQQWMDSPGHRANLVNPAFHYLGCSARCRKDYSGLDLLYSVQVFFTPQ